MPKKVIKIYTKKMVEGEEVIDEDFDREDDYGDSSEEEEEW